MCLGVKLKGGCEGRWASRRDRGVREVEAGPAGLALGPPADHKPWVLCGCVTVSVCVTVCVRVRWDWFCSHSFLRMSRKDPVLSSV